MREIELICLFKLQSMKYEKIDINDKNILREARKYETMAYMLKKRKKKIINTKSKLNYENK